MASLYNFLSNSICNGSVYNKSINCKERITKNQSELVLFCINMWYYPMPIHDFLHLKCFFYIISCMHDDLCRSYEWYYKRLFRKLCPKTFHPWLIFLISESNNIVLSHWLWWSSVSWPQIRMGPHIWLLRKIWKMKSFRNTLNISQWAYEEPQIKGHCDVAINCDGEVIVVDGGAILWKTPCGYNIKSRFLQ